MNSSLPEVLELLRYRFVDGPAATAKPALERFRHAQGSSRREIALATLLRDHRERSIESRGEVNLRDSFDELLAYYSALEIAFRARALTAIPKTHLHEALSVLQHPAVRAYYESYYPLVLPQLLRRRLGSLQKRDRGSQPLTATDSVLSRYLESEDMFYKFLDISLTIEDGSKDEDGDVETFFWLLDDGTSEDGYVIEDFVSVTKRQREFLARLQKPEEEQDWLDASLHGCRKFLTFCSSFELFLNQITDPLLQSAYWHYHGYWFEHLQTELGTNVIGALQNFAHWRSSAQATESSIASVQGAVCRLTSGRFGWRLREELLRPLHV